jgi:hypothetical protein
MVVVRRRCWPLLVRQTGELERLDVEVIDPVGLVPEDGRGLDIAREHRVADLDDNGDWVVGDRQPA